MQSTATRNTVLLPPLQALWIPIRPRVSDEDDPTETLASTLKSATGVGQPVRTPWSEREKHQVDRRLPVCLPCLQSGQQKGPTLAFRELVLGPANTTFSGIRCLALGQDQHVR